MRTPLKMFVIIASLLFFTKSQAQVIRQILDAVKPQKRFDGIPTFKKGTHLLYVGMQAPNNLKTFLNFSGLASLFLSPSASKSNGPFFIGYEYGLKNDIGIGLTAQYAQAEQTYTAPFGLGTNVTGKIDGYAILFSTIYHIYSTDKLDPYFRGSFGVNIWKGSYRDNSNNEVQKFNAPSPIAYTSSLGLRYFVTKTLAPFGELSYSNIKFTAGIGLCIKVGDKKQTSPH